jgi:hypothetical protein
MKIRTILVSFTLLISGCDLSKLNSEDQDKKFLTGGKKVTNEEANPREEKALSEISQVIKIQSSDWDKLTMKLKQCEAERSSENARKDDELEAARNQGKSECLQNIDTLVNEKASVSLKDTVAMAETLKTELLKYKFGYALVNGDCMGKMADGHLRMIRVKGDACLSVPFTKVGSGDGEIKGIEEAVSPEAMADGILSLNCDAGHAHFRMANTPCPAQTGTVAKSSFEKM